jgi:hypothetical protein
MYIVDKTHLQVRGNIADSGDRPGRLRTLLEACKEAWGKERTAPAVANDTKDEIGKQQHNLTRETVAASKFKEQLMANDDLDTPDLHHLA